MTTNGGFLNGAAHSSSIGIFHSNGHQQNGLALAQNQNSTSVSKLNAGQQMTNSLFIRKEIQRFESVHPNIYSVYDLIDSIHDFNLQQQIREHIVNIEGNF
jgi:hypothetical protein